MFGESVHVVETRRKKKVNTDHEVGDIRDLSAEVDDPQVVEMGCMKPLPNQDLIH